MSGAPPFVSELSATSSIAADYGFSTTSEPAQLVATCPCQLPPAAMSPPVRQPCDVSRFVMADHVTGAIVHTTRTRVNEVPGADTPVHLRHELTQYDLILERVVDYVGRQIDGTTRQALAPRTHMAFKAVSSQVGTCGSAEHPRIEMQPLDTVQCEPKLPFAWRAAETTMFEFLGRPSPEDEQALVSFLAPLWAIGAEPQSWVVAVTSCGIRDPGSKVVTSLTGLVRVYSHDEYELSFTLPAAIGFAGEKSGSINVKGDVTDKSSNTLSRAGRVVASRESEQTDNGAGGWSQSTSNSSRTADGLRSQSATVDLDKAGKIKATTKDTLQADAHDGALMLVRTSRVIKDVAKTDEPEKGVARDVAFTADVEIRPTLSLKKNGRELDFTKFLSNILNLSAKIAKAVEDIQKLVPTVGWKVTFDLKLLEGSITGKWGVQNGEALDVASHPIYVYASDRYVAVRKYYGLKFELVVFGATLKLLVGVEVKVNAVFWNAAELVITLTGTLAGEVAMDWETTSDTQTKPPILNCTLTGTVSGVCKANLAGYSLVDAAAKLSGGLKFSGSPYVSLDHAPRIDSTLVLVETKVTYWGSIGKEPPEPVVVPIYEERPLWTGDLLAASVGA